MTAQTVAHHAQNSTQNKTSLTKKRRVLELDGIRGLAIIAVLLYHLRPAILRGGFIGVTVFFVLSGFLNNPKRYALHCGREFFIFAIFTQTHIALVGASFYNNHA